MTFRAPEKLILHQRGAVLCPKSCCVLSLERQIGEVETPGIDLQVGCKGVGRWTSYTSALDRERALAHVSFFPSLHRVPRERRHLRASFGSECAGRMFVTRGSQAWISPACEHPESYGPRLQDLFTRPRSPIECVQREWVGQIHARSRRPWV